MSLKQRFEFLPHTADIKIKVYGATREELFINAMYAMACILKKAPGAGGKSTSFAFAVSSPSFDALLVDVLGEILTRSEIEKAVFFDADALVLEERGGRWSARGTVRGVFADGFDEDIKAVTYHEAAVRQNKEGIYETDIIFDI